MIVRYIPKNFIHKQRHMNVNSTETTLRNFRGCLQNLKSENIEFYVEQGLQLVTS